MSPDPDRGTRRAAWLFIAALGVVSLFADVTYEGMRGIVGPYLGLLGAGALAVGVVAGGGELLGYGIRLVAGRAADRTRRYWGLTLAGYGINLLAVPALALAGRWEVAAALVLAERAGKGLRTPARDVLLSHAARRVGTGRAFGVHEAMDQIGAVAGPLAVALVASRTGSARVALAWLLVPAAAALGVLAAARTRWPAPARLEGAGEEPPGAEGFGVPARVFLLYLAAVALLAAGFADFPLVAYRLHDDAVLSTAAIPAAYALAMGVDALAALGFGWGFDRWGAGVLGAGALLSAAAVPLAFLGGAPVALVGVGLWGLGMGAQESVLRAAVAEMVPAARRGTAYGTMELVRGVAWFGGSALLGALYGVSIPLLAGVGAGLQAAAAVVFVLAARRSGE